MPKKNGFTLIEILMAITLVAVISLAVYGSFSSGVRIMRRIAHPAFEEEASVVFEKISRELENSFLNADIPFTGEKDRFAFATIIRSEPVLGGARAVGQVTYFYDSYGKSMSRRQEDVHQIYKEQEGPAKPLFEHVHALHFQYFGYETSQSQYLWTDDWDPALKKNKSPMAVKIEFEFDDGETRQNLTRTIAIPVGE